MTDQPPATTGKAAIHSVSQWGSVGVMVFWAVGLALKHFGVSPDDVKGATSAVKQLIDLGYQAAIPLGALVAIFGRWRATQPITGVLKAAPTPALPQSQPPAMMSPPAEDPPY